MRDYFTYLPLADEPPVWGVAVTAAGFSRIPSGTDYPPPEAHPPDHMFTWDHGRVLETWQAIWITVGSGLFESRPTGRRRVRDGTMILLFPGVWHRYTPDPKTGWVESWIEFEGPVPDNLRKHGALRPQRSILHLGSQPELTELLDRCHLLAQNRPVGFSGQLAASTLQLLAQVLTLSQTSQGAPRRMHDVMRRAQGLLMERCDQPIRMRDLAQELGVGYSHFRRMFQLHTGLSPKQYVTSMRLRRVRALLRNSTLTIKEIAERMGYHSPYHLSAEFKKHTGQSPIRWRYRRAQ